jgi:hypothetical protein
MRQRGHRDGLDVVGDHEVAAVERGLDAAELISASVPRGLAPTWTLGLIRVASTSATM